MGLDPAHIAQRNPVNQGLNLTGPQSPEVHRRARIEVDRMLSGDRLTLLLAKVVLTPLFIAAVTLAGRRWGPAVGGWLAGLPLTSGPVSVFLALEQGPGFAARASSRSSFCRSAGWPRRRPRS